MAMLNNQRVYTHGRYLQLPEMAIDRDWILEITLSFLVVLL